MIFHTKLHNILFFHIVLWLYMIQYVSWCVVVCLVFHHLLSSHCRRSTSQSKTFWELESSNFWGRNPALMHAPTATHKQIFALLSVAYSLILYLFQEARQFITFFIIIIKRQSWHLFNWPTKQDNWWLPTNLHDCTSPLSGTHRICKIPFVKIPILADRPIL